MGDQKKIKLEEQENVLKNSKKRMLVSASAGSGKTFIMIEYIKKLICERRIPVNKLLILTFTKSAALQMKDRLVSALKEQSLDEFIVEQLDLISVSNISTIHAFCEKYIKKYANMLDLRENFSILDENESTKIRNDAMENAFKIFEKQNAKLYDEVMSSYKNNKKKVFEILIQIKNLTSAVANKEEFIKNNTQNPEKYFEKAEKFLFLNTKKAIEKQIIQIENLHCGEFDDSLKQNLLPILSCNDLLEMSNRVEEVVLPRIPSRKVIGDEAVEALKNVKSQINFEIKKIKSLRLNEKENVSLQKRGILETGLLTLFSLFEKEEEKIKKAQNSVDFNDLEKYMSILSEKENLFEGIEYVFVDEYQDTNKIQEKIIKNVAKNCNFVAVGDVKQGIYGFRLASSEIFLKDLHDFEEDDDSVVNYLQSNFRSDKRVLDFVNSIFSVCMTENQTGVDYAKTSMLCGRGEFVDDGQKAVFVDIVQSQKEQGELPKLYSVKDAKITQDNSNALLLRDVRSRIAHALTTQISDGGTLRPVTFGDIAILSRSRNPFFGQLEAFLRESGIPVVANSREKLMGQPEIKVLVNYLKLVKVLDDDVALLSVLTSGLYCLKMEEIFAEKNTEESLCEAVTKNERENVVFDEFLKNLQNFRDFYQIFGLKRAFYEFFEKRNYFSYLNLYHPNLIVFVNKFLEEIEKFDFDLPSAINFFETVDVVVSSENARVEDAVLLTTIHNSKGLEYPIVFLIGCDNNFMASGKTNEVEIDQQFGLSVKIYDKENSSELQSVRMCACRESRKQREMCEELMIFYVALTRAKNRLYLFGEEKNFDAFCLDDCKSYLDLIFYALKDVKKEFDASGKYENEELQFSFVSELPEDDFRVQQNIENSEKDEKIIEKIKKYIDFSYNFGESLNFKLKESVTSLNNKNQENSLQRYNGDAINFDDNMVVIGNAYHYALKEIDFEKINSVFDLEKALAVCEEKGVQTKLIDVGILFKDVLLLKNITHGGEIFKEREFVMKARLCDILPTSQTDEILVQGVIDLFVVKDGHAVLVDYKFSNSKNPTYLVEKYKNQLKLYKKAIKDALKIEVDEIFLLSLKNSKLIEVK